MLQILDYLFEGTDSHWEALSHLDEALIVELMSLVTRQPKAFIEEHWDFPSALSVVMGFWASPERKWLSTPPEEEFESEEPEGRVSWVSSIIERLSYGRGWSADYILDLPFLAVLKFLERLDERGWDENVQTISSVERGVSRALTIALGKGDSLPDLSTYRDMKRRRKEQKEIMRIGRRFFEAALE